MSVKSKPYYLVVCDWEGCRANAQEYGDFSAWSDESHAIEDAENLDWLTVRFADGTERHYCLEHTHWSDDEDEMVPGLAENHTNGGE